CSIRLEGLTTLCVWSGNWGVTSTDQCALKGTSVLIKCEYDYPSGLVVTGVAWYQRQRISGLVHLSKIRSAPDHFRYVGNKWSNCSLRINDVQSSDAREYYFQFKTTLNNKWLSQRPGSVCVSQLELTAFVEPSTVTEGDCVNLACVSGCPSHVDVVWFKDGQPVANPIFQARREDAGRYYCAVQGQEMIRSASVALNVQYAPRKVSLSVSPSSEVLKGSAVTFTCSSDANPTVTHNGYSLHKDGHLISSGANHSISDIQPSYSGLFWCQARNTVGETNSTEVLLTISAKNHGLYLLTVICFTFKMTILHFCIQHSTSDINLMFVFKTRGVRSVVHEDIRNMAQINMFTLTNIYKTTKESGFQYY
uniref:Ig-like domain-containing protein n=1 Tax=Labrus bergylta TaxID=56723 RepID=A0A3Q3EQ35_9LABR